MTDEKVNVIYSIDDKASPKASKLTSVLNKLKAVAIGVGVAGIGAITFAIKKGLDSWGVQEKAVAQLNQSLKNTGHFSKQASQDLQDYASALQKTTTFGDEAIVQGMSLIASFGFQGEELKSLTKATLDLASAKGMDLKTASDLVAKAVGSDTNALSRYGVTIEGVAGSTDRAKSAVEAITKLFGGQAEAEANTYAGAIAQMKNAVDDAGEEIGKVFAPIIIAISKKISALANWFGGLSDNTKLLIFVVGGVASAMLALIPVIGMVTTAIAGLGVAMNVALFGIPVLIALIVTGFVLLAKNAETIKVKFQNAFDVMRIGFNNVLISILTGLKKLTDQLNKIPGINIKTDGAIENLQKLNEELAKNMDERKEILVEKQSAEDQALLDKLQSTEQKKVEIATATDEAIKESKFKAEKEILDSIEARAEIEGDIAQATANVALDYTKKSATEKIKVWGAEQTAIAMGEIASIFGAPMGFLRLAGVGVAMAGVGAINAIKLANGGSFMVDQPTMIAPNVMAGEQKIPERIDVTPMNQQKDSTIVLNVNVGEEKVITKIFKLGQKGRQEGYINDGLRRNF